MKLDMNIIMNSPHDSFYLFKLTLMCTYISPTLLNDFFGFGYLGPAFVLMLLMVA